MSNYYKIAKAFFVEHGLSEPSAMVDRFAVDLSFLYFYPNHIKSVLDKVVKNQKAMDRLITNGWGRYMLMPLWSMLKDRKGARATPILDSPLTTYFTDVWRFDVYHAVHTAIINYDYNRNELIDLLVSIPDHTHGSKDALKLAISVTRAAHVGNPISYLRGVCVRESARVRARLDELDRLDREGQAEIFDDDVYHTPEVIDRMEEHHRDLSDRMMLRRMLRDK